MKKAPALGARAENVGARQPTSNAPAPHNQDRAAFVARAILQMIAQSLTATSADQITLYTAVTALLRDEFAATQNETLSEIRLNDE